MSSENALARREDRPLSTADWAARESVAWSESGCGAREWDFPVLLEPPFQPVFADPPVIEDDGRKHIFVTALVERVGNWLSGVKPKTDLVKPPEDYHWLAFPDAGPPVEFQVLVPPKLNISFSMIEQFLANLNYCRLPLCFELVATHESISIQFSVNESDAEQVELQLNAYFPEIAFVRRKERLERIWMAASGDCPVFLDFGLEREFVIPIAGSRKLGLDPFIGLCGAMADLDPGEVAVWQVIFERARNDWRESIGRYARVNERLAGYAKEKVSCGLFAVVARLAAKSSEALRSWHIARNFAGALGVFDDPHGNALRPLKNIAYDDSRHEADLLLRRAHRSGMLLNADELLGLVHWPTPSVRTPRLERMGKKTKSAPDLAIGNELLLGINDHNGEEQPVSLDPPQRTRHMHLIGASGTGKSTMLLNMIVQDIENGHGLAVLDPHGDLVEAILARIFEHRHKDVVLVDPADEEFPVGFNILSAHSNLEKNLLASDLVSIFRRLSTSWGDNMTSALGNAILAFLESTEGGTISDLRRFLLEPGYRSEFLETVQDSEVVYFWKKEFPLLVGRPQAPLLTRLDTFLRPKPIRYMVGQKENRLDFASIMDSRKIFLAKLSQGLIGHENSQLLGALFVSKFHQMVMGRQDTRESDRRYFWLYVDEFQDFVTPSMAAILSGARKYRLGLVLSHQDMQQIQSRDADVNSAVLSNVYTRVCFRLGDADARRLSEGLSAFDAGDLQNLSTGEAICRMERSSFDFNLRTEAADTVDDDLAKARRDSIARHSRQTYARPRTEVEQRMKSATESHLVSEKPNAEPKPPRSVLSSEPVPAKVVRTDDAPIAPSSGKGGHRHQALQEVLKQWAEDNGLRAKIEKSVPDGEGSADVEVLAGESKIACEISVSTSADHEVGNISKCLTAGYSYVLAICPERGRLAKLRKAAYASLPADALKRVSFVTMVGALTFIQGLRESRKATGASGWDVRSAVHPPGTDEATQNEVVQSVLKTGAGRSREKK